MFGDSAGFVVASHHESGDVLEEHQWGVTLVAQFDEVCTLLCRFAEQHTVVCDDAYRVAVDAGEPGDERVAVFGFKLVELRSVNDACDDLADVVRGFEVRGYHVGEFVRGVFGFLWFSPFPCGGGCCGQGGHDVAHDFERVVVVGGQMVGNARGACVEHSPAEFFCCDDFTGGGFHQGWAA